MADGRFTRVPCLVRDNMPGTPADEAFPEDSSGKLTTTTLAAYASPTAKNATTAWISRFGQRRLTHDIDTSVVFGAPVGRSQGRILKRSFSFFSAETTAMNPNEQTISDAPPGSRETCPALPRLQSGDSTPPGKPINDATNHHPGLSTAPQAFIIPTNVPNLGWARGRKTNSASLGSCSKLLDPEIKPPLDSQQAAAAALEVARLLQEEVLRETPHAQTSVSQASSFLRGNSGAKNSTARRTALKKENQDQGGMGAKGGKRVTWMRPLTVLFHLGEERDSEDGSVGVPLAGVDDQARLAALSPARVSIKGEESENECKRIRQSPE